MNLYLIVGTYTSFDGDELDTEWLFVVRDKYPEYDESKALLEQHIADVVEIDREDFDVVDVWSNGYTEVDGYKITLEKEQ